MNVVGKVGSLITQGVYSVATPFHPFGGAVDVIVVQQQDGSFRSTPWYVRFGKFQGVLKGAEKIVRIAVNGVEADFHMYLDNSGEAYFIREVKSGEGGESQKSGKDSDTNVNVSRLEHSVSDSGVAQLREELDSSVAENRLERAESEGIRRFYDYQDERSSLGGLSEYGSSRFENFDADKYGDLQGGIGSEVVLVSVDGHILTAPVLASEQDTENVQLSTPQFHLGPGEGPEFCEENAEFTSDDSTWASDYISKLDPSVDNGDTYSVCCANEEDNASPRPLEVCEGEGKHQNVERNSHIHSDSEDGCVSIKRDDVFKSCLELSKLAHPVGYVDSDQHSPQKSPRVLTEDDKIEDNSAGHRNDDASPSCKSNSPGSNVSQNLLVDSISVHSNIDPRLDDEQLTASEPMEGFGESPLKLESELESTELETIESRSPPPAERIVGHVGFEISLCRNDLYAGMGLAAAAQTFDAHRILGEEYMTSAESIVKNENLVVRIGENYFPWEKAAPVVLGMAVFGLELPAELKYAIPVEQVDQLKAKQDDAVVTPSSSGRRWRLWPNPFRRVKTLEHTNSNDSGDEVFVDSESELQTSPSELTALSEKRVESPRSKFIRTNAPTSEQIASLNLKDGQNVVTFSFESRFYLGVQQVDAHMYLWKWNARIVISDVDGTITKSDVLGQFMPLVGKDWTQSGVAKLFSAIKENGYQLLFLSARAIVQAYLTRSYLLNLKQDGNALPNGPVVISPDGLFPSLYREVIRRAPHEFKIACLEDIRKLFPPEHNPFYAGFGNRDTDELSYRKIGIPKGKIFIINPKGEVAISHRIDVKSYTSLHTLVNDMFPPTSLIGQAQEDFNAWNFWKMPLPEIDL